MTRLELIGIGLAYLGLLFGIAAWIERKRPQGRVWNAVTYSLGMAVYCTAWTYYGSVGRAADRGMDFLAIYLGPTLSALLFWPVLNQLITVSRTHRLTSVADVLSVRFGRSTLVGRSVAWLSFVGLVPYIALQIKAIVDSYRMMNHGETDATWLAIFSAAALLGFVVLFGQRHLDSQERHQGLMGAIAFESLVKLLALLAVGILALYLILNPSSSNPTPVLTAPTWDGQNWPWLVLVSSLAFFTLPRQFHTAVVENRNTEDVQTASWLFPLYLFAITLLVLPLAWAGLQWLPATSPPDMYVLNLPRTLGYSSLAVAVWVGGLSAASSMIIVETVALSGMISNHLVLPWWFRNQSLGREGAAAPVVLRSRRLVAFAVLSLSVVYYLTLGQDEALVSTGLISFVAVAQFAPGLIAALRWTEAHRTGVASGILAGATIWAYTLIVPALAHHGWIDSAILTQGPWGLEWLRPESIWGTGEALDPISHAAFWSLSTNTLALVVFSTARRRSPEERYLSDQFVQNWRTDDGSKDQLGRGSALLRDLEGILAAFLGMARAQNLLQGYAKRHGMTLEDQGYADPRLVLFTEQILSGLVGDVSARLLMRQHITESSLQPDEVLDLVRENRSTRDRNKELQRQSSEMERAAQVLKEANQAKDQFLTTVTHELRTPLTSLQALSEILADNPDMDAEQRATYLEALVGQTERMGHLIDQVLRLERFEQGRDRLRLTALSGSDLLQSAIRRVEPQIQQRGLTLHAQYSQTMSPMMADADLLEQVLVNLLSNASKFAHAEIHVIERIDETQWSVYVSDDGPGVPPGDQPYIFEKFYQSANQNTQKPEGSGLGLAISKQISELHGGQLRLAPTTRGATFVVTLPLHGTEDINR